MAEEINRTHDTNETGEAKSTPDLGPWDFEHVEEFLSKPTTIEPYVVDKILLACRFSVISSRPKIGKSTFLQNLALAVATGQPFLRRFATIKGGVLYAALEEIPEQLRIRLRMIGVAESMDIRVHTGTFGFKKYDETVKKLAQAIAYYKPILVIIDHMSLLVRTDDINDYSKVTKNLTPLREITRNLKTHIIVAHHATKADRDDNRSVLGSTAIPGAVDSIITIDKKDERRTFSTDQRYLAKLDKVPLIFESETNELYVSDVDLPVKDVSQRDDVESRIVTFLMDNPESTASDIAGAIPKRRADVLKAIKRLTSEVTIRICSSNSSSDPTRYVVVDKNEEFDEFFGSEVPPPGEGTGELETASREADDEK